MSQKISPLAIGGFTVGALALFILGLFIFSSGQLFNKDKVRYVIFFSSSLNGLDVGAPVKMQGVKIGEVTEIKLQLDPETSQLYKPVVVEIDRSSLSATGGSALPVIMTGQQMLEERDKIVNAGFRARLELQSLLTGLLYVDLDLHPGTQPAYIGLEYNGILELPGVPATTDEIRQTAEQLSEKLQSIPLDEIIQNLSESLVEIRNLLVSEDFKQSRTALLGTLRQSEQLLTTMNKHMEPLLISARHTVNNSNGMINDARAQLKPALLSLNTTLQAADEALQTSDQTMHALGNAVKPSSPLAETLKAVRDAARSVKNLSDYLERHPESLISGKKP